MTKKTKISHSILILPWWMLKKLEIRRFQMSFIRYFRMEKGDNSSIWRKYLQTGSGYVSGNVTPIIFVSGVHPIKNPFVSQINYRLLVVTTEVTGNVKIQRNVVGFAKAL